MLINSACTRCCVATKKLQYMNAGLNTEWNINLSLLLLCFVLYIIAVLLIAGRFSSSPSKKGRTDSVQGDYFGCVHWSMERTTGYASYWFHMILIRVFSVAVDTIHQWTRQWNRLFQIAFRICIPINNAPECIWNISASEILNCPDTPVNTYNTPSQ